MNEPETAENLVDDLLKSVPTVGNFDITAVPLDRLTDDVARKIYEYPDIAARYGLTMPQLYLLVANPEICKLIKIKRAIWTSDKAAPDRVRHYWQVGLEEASPSLIQLFGRSDIPAALKIDLLKIGTRIAGIDIGSRNGDVREPGGGGDGSAKFAVNIMFASGEVERISTSRTIEGRTERTDVTPEDATP